MSLSRPSRRSVLAQAAALLPLTLCAARTFALTLTTDEAVTILRQISERVPALADEAAMGEHVALRASLRAGAYSQLRLSVRTLQQAQPTSAELRTAAQRTITALEQTDTAALRASRGQTANDAVVACANTLRDALADLLTLVQ